MSIIFNVYIITMGETEAFTLMSSNVCLVQQKDITFHKYNTRLPPLIYRLM